MPLIESLSGIRGIWGADLNEAIAAKYASAYLSFLSKRIGKGLTLAIGMDTRPSGHLLKNAITEALDCNFIDVGMAPTPAIELAVRESGADGGIIMTASHNEPAYNGLKFLRKDGAVLSENDMQQVIGICGKIKGLRIRKSRLSKISDKSSELSGKYGKFVLDFIGKGSIEKIKKSNIKIVLDPNGGAGIAAKEILQKLGADIAGVNMEPGVFGRKVEPDEDSLFYLSNIIRESKADFAVGLDCDADRAEMILPDGSIVSGHYILALVSKYILSSNDKNYYNNKNIKNNEYNNKIVVVNDATSNVVREVVESLNGRIIETGVGEINVVDEMLRQDAVLGGEGSSAGAIIPPSRCRDGILTTACVLALIANEGKSLSSIIKEMPKYYTLKRKLAFNRKNHDSMIDGIKKYYTKNNFKIRSLSDSIKVAAGRNSFVWFRASKTESGVFRVIADSDNKSTAESLMEDAIKVVSNAGKS
ncbi:hypothetical protein HYT54_02035 [Candidatus Woesearchaeota archaeon]|nr:hypothetical protein [Candidatus Woesearchaeota archaeon]